MKPQKTRSKTNRPAPTIGRERALAPWRGIDAPGAGIGKGSQTFTAAERAFIERAAEGCTLKDLAFMHGLTVGEARAFMARLDVREALTRQREALLLGYLAPKAGDAIGALLSDPETTPSVRANLAVKVLKLASDVDARADAAPPSLDVLSLPELEAHAAALRAELDADEKTITGAQIDITGLF